MYIVNELSVALALQATLQVNPFSRYFRQPTQRTLDLFLPILANVHCSRHRRTTWPPIAMSFTSPCLRLVRPIGKIITLKELRDYTHQSSGHQDALFPLHTSSFSFIGILITGAFCLSSIIVFSKFGSTKFLKRHCPPFNFFPALLLCRNVLTKDDAAVRTEMR